MHFTGASVQRWTRDLQIDWKFHVACHPQAAGMTEQCSGLLKQGLQVAAATQPLRGWTKRLWTVLRTLHERSQNGGAAPVEALLHWTAPPIQLQV